MAPLIWSVTGAAAVPWAGDIATTPATATRAKTRIRIAEPPSRWIACEPAAPGRAPGQEHTAPLATVAKIRSPERPPSSPTVPRGRLRRCHPGPDREVVVGDRLVAQEAHLALRERQRHPGRVQGRVHGGRELRLDHRPALDAVRPCPQLEVDRAVAERLEDHTWRGRLRDLRMRAPHRLQHVHDFFGRAA